MDRKRQTSILDDVFELLKHTPWWIGPVLAAVVFLGIRYGVPHLFAEPKGGVDPRIGLTQLIPGLSWIGGGIVLVAWAAAEIAKFSNRRLFDGQKDINSIRQISWHEFERLVTEAYRRRGYLAEHVGSPSGDGGIDILLHGHGEKVFVQCKQWKAFKVGASPVRELLGVVTSEKADRGILVTSGRFTSEALRFWERNEKLELIDGKQLAAMIGEAQRNIASKELSMQPSSASAAIPNCPSCGKVMVIRTARRGKGAGSKFWGCQKYPACNGTRPEV